MRAANDITAELIASGLTPAQTALLMELVLSMSTGLSTGQGGENRAIEKRRAWDRDRQARKREVDREAKRLSAMSTGHPPESTGHQVDFADVCSDEEEKNRSFQGKIKKENKKGSRLLSGARVSDENRVVAIENGCPPDRVDKVWTEFVDYWSDIPGHKGCKLNWTGTWRNRIKFIFERTGNGNGKAQDNPRAGSLIGALDRAIAKAEFEENLGLEVPADNLLSLPGRSIQRS